MTSIRVTTNGSVLRSIGYGPCDVSYDRALRRRSDKPSVKLSVALLRAHHDALKAYAEGHGETISAVVVRLVAQLIEAG